MQKLHEVVKYDVLYYHFIILIILSIIGCMNCAGGDSYVDLLLCDPAVS
jgi:hypothetical protein